MALVKNCEYPSAHTCEAMRHMTRHQAEVTAGPGAGFDDAVTVARSDPLLRKQRVYPRIFPKHARNSSVNSAGCSKAAKWPPRSSRFQ
jgi:hypothetical protein